MFSTTFRLLDSIRTASRMLLAALLAIAFVASGQAFAPTVPQVQTQTEVTPISPPKYKFKKIKTEPNPGDAKSEFTIDSDVTIDSL